ncbi:MAG TPA: GNAT family N-acetyltransferase [Candidatus Angelobacter sp.]
MNIVTRIRQAVAADIPNLRELIDASVRGLQAGDYTPAQIESALATVYGVDTQLIADGTYFVAEVESRAGAIASHSTALRTTDSISEERNRVIAGCGGWSKRKTLYGADHCAGREDDLLDPRKDAAKIRAFFVHPDWARRGIGSMILEACETAARAAGFTRLEMGATLTGVPFYRARGYVVLERLEVPLENGASMPIVRMGKQA